MGHPGRRQPRWVASRRTSCVVLGTPRGLGRGYAGRVRGLDTRIARDRRSAGSIRSFDGEAPAASAGSRDKARIARAGALQDKLRRHPDQNPKAGQPRRREPEYVRHGTASLFAALDVHTGQVLAELIPGKNDSVNVRAFLDEIERTVDPAPAIHVVLDNGSSHVSKYTKAWFAAHPTLVVHYPPPHASWVNQVELFFLDLAAQGHPQQQLRLTRRPHRQAPQLPRRLRPDRQPFKWTYAADPA